VNRGRKSGFAPVEKHFPSVAKATVMVMVMDGLKAVPFNRFFITLGGPSAHDNSGRMTIHL
jgi:hypothetical protein